MNNNNQKDFRDRIKYENKDQQDIHEKFISLLDKYEKQNSFENREYLCYLTAAIYLTYRKLFPQLSIYIPFRTKSDMSFIRNLQKEFDIYIKDLDSDKPFDATAITKDISGIKIILDDINYSRPATGLSPLILDDPEIQKLSPYYKEKPQDISNYDFITKVQNFIYSPIKTSSDGYKLKQELLERILKMTPSEFTDERMPNPSFARLYEEAKYKYNYFLENDDFPTDFPLHEEKELNELLDNFRSISNDQYHFAILNKTLPIVLEDPLIKNVLQTSFKKEKELKKPNGFQSIYYSINTPFGQIETQAQSNKAHYAATKGSAYHSGLSGKTINIKNFFELVDPNDDHELSYYLDALDSASADRLTDSYELPEFKNEEEKKAFIATPEGQTYLISQRYHEMIKHIKLKDKINIQSQNGSDNIIELDVNDYLLSTALSFSPYMNVCGSGHTSSTTAAIHHKKVIDEFAEVLRKKDSNTCLRDLLIRRLELLIENNGILDNSSENISINRINSIKIAKHHEEESLKLPKDISKKTILGYGQKLREMQKESDKQEIEF